MGLMKVFSGSEILAIALKERLAEAGVETAKKDNIESARLGGFDAADLAVDVFIQEADFEKANPVIEDFYMSI